MGQFDSCTFFFFFLILQRQEDETTRILNEERAMADLRARDAERLQWEESVRYQQELEKQLDEQVSRNNSSKQKNCVCQRKSWRHGGKMCPFPSTGFEPVPLGYAVCVYVCIIYKHRKVSKLVAFQGIRFWHDGLQPSNWNECPWITLHTESFSLSVLVFFFWLLMFFGMCSFLIDMMLTWSIRWWIWCALSCNVVKSNRRNFWRRKWWSTRLCERSTRRMNGKFFFFFSYSSRRKRTQENQGTKVLPSLWCF